jgi:glycosyltransferase involved in cell wall biosynthesis
VGIGVSKPLSLAVVIPTLNSAQTLGRCLTSIANQSRPVSEVIVVDDVKSVDQTRELVEEAGARLIVADANMAESRNVGFRSSSSDLLLSIDSDMVLSTHLAEEVVSALADKGVDALTIKEIGIGSGYWARARAIDKAAVEALGDGRAIRAFTRRLYEQVGGFDSAMPSWDDWDFTRKALRAGAHILHLEAPIWHDEGRLTLRRAVSKKYEYGRAARSFAKRYGARSVVAPVAHRVLVGIRDGWRTDPLAVPGFILLKALDVAAGALGALGTFRQA